jgi:hypothetical protein
MINTRLQLVLTLVEVLGSPLTSPNMQEKIAYTLCILCDGSRSNCEDVESSGGQRVLRELMQKGTPKTRDCASIALRIISMEMLHVSLVCVRAHACPFHVRALISFGMCPCKLCLFDVLFV